LAAFIGAVAGGLFTMWGAEKNHRDQVRRDEKEEADRQAMLLRAILAEMETLAAIYMRGTGRLLEQKAEQLIFCKKVYTGLGGLSFSFP